ncbi:MAG: DUF3305 domain-containing protein [SAR324 cluster bacterium]|nr:DUF3305 domain-containing protein [SAR324 cluster bacterium]MBL7034824.1 DUF3305 domain-containing protein [SAR324 cluster bacterium]
MSDFKREPEKYSKFQVKVMMEKKDVADNPWTDVSWKSIGVMIDSRSDPEVKRFERVVSDSDYEQYLWSGLSLSLYVDECESYYYNLLSETPLIFVISRQNEVLNLPEPFLVTASFDEANAYQESDELVYSAPVSPDIYCRIEGFVLENYVPEKKIKRKRKE